MPITSDTFLTQVLDKHPVVSHAMATIRHKETNAEGFRIAMRQVGQVLMSEATKTLPTVPITVETPMQPTTVDVRDPNIPILIVPILRAGLAWSELALDWIPEAHVYHLGMARNEETLQPETYYNKLEGGSFHYNTAKVLVLDPMLATGGSAVGTLQVLKSLGVQEANMTFVCLIASPEGLEYMAEHVPQVRIITAALDEGLNEKGYILPGLGDAGDRTFGTL
jgi:uracil phosphoribosyltransferase